MTEITISGAAAAVARETAEHIESPGRTARLMSEIAIAFAVGFVAVAIALHLGVS
jgi:hypothetical protein